MVNTYGPQTRSEGVHGSSHKTSVPIHDCGNQAVEERLQNIEAHLRLQTGLYHVLILTSICQFVLVIITVVKLDKSIKTVTVKTMDRSTDVFSYPKYYSRMFRFLYPKWNPDSHPS